MKKSLLIIGFFTVLFWTAFSQPEQKVDSTIFDEKIQSRIYTIGFNEFQIIELIEFIDSTYKGSLTFRVNELSRKEEIKDTVTQKLEIPPITVKYLIQNLKDNNIETLRNSEDVEGVVIGLDGTYVSFDIKTSKITRSYYYWEPESNYYQDEAIEEIRQVRRIVSLLKEQTNMMMHWKNFSNSLPLGNYSYGGIIMIKTK